jgi:hypothetical protein
MIAKLIVVKPVKSLARIPTPASPWLLEVMEVLLSEMMGSVLTRDNDSGQRNVRPRRSN